MLNLDYLSNLFREHEAAYSAHVQEFEINGVPLSFNNRPAIMGVINLSPDSWYRESVCLTVESALKRGKVLSAQGADVIDIGAESTLARAALVDGDRQLSLLRPVLEGLGDFVPILSVETYREAVAIQSLQWGARIINFTGSNLTEPLMRVVAEHQAAFILCLVQGEHVRAVGELKWGEDPIAGMYEYFARQVEILTHCGVTRIFLDPGLGFYYKNLQDSDLRVRYQMKTFLHTFRLRKLGFPICHALPHAFEYFGEEVRSAESLFAVLAVLGKTDLFRTHEVPRIQSVLKTLSLLS